MTTFSSLCATSRLLRFAAALSLLALIGSLAPRAAAQQSPKRNADVLVTFAASAPDVTFQPGFPAANQGTLNLVIKDRSSELFKRAWNGTQGAAAGALTHSGAFHILLRPYREYTVDLSRVGQPSAACDLKISAPPGFAVYIEDIPRESFRAVPAQLTAGVFTFMIREVGDGGLLPVGMAAAPEVGDFVWTLSAGRFSNGRSLAPVQLRATALSADLLSPRALLFSELDSPEVAVTRHSDGGLLEIETFQAKFYFRRGTPSGGYTIEVYSPYATRTGTGDGPYTYSEAPYREFRFRNPAGTTSVDQLEIEKFEREGTTTRSETWRIAQTGNDWTIVETNQLRTITRTSSPSGANRQEIIEVKDNGSPAKVATKLRRVYAQQAWGQEELIEETANPDATDGIALTTMYSYNQTTGTGGYGRLESVTAPDGSWVRYVYNNSALGLGNLIQIRRPWQGTPVSAASANVINSHVTILNYAVGRTNYEDVPSGSITRIRAATTGVSRVATTYPTTRAGNGQPLRREQITTFTSLTVSLDSVVQSYDPTTADVEFRGRPYSEVGPTGQQTSYLRYRAYFWHFGDSDQTLLRRNTENPALNNTWGEYRFHGFSTAVTGAVAVSSWDGQTFEPIYLVPNRSTVDLVVYNHKGAPQYTVNYVFTGASNGAASFSFLSMTETIDDGGIPALQRSPNGFLTSRSYLGDELTRVVANDGSTTEITRDALGRETLLQRTGVIEAGSLPAQGAVYTHRTFDASNRVLTEKLSASAAPTDAGIETSTSYFLNGLVKSTTDSSGLTTSFAYSNGGRTTTITSPLGVSTVDRHPLGTLTTGATVIPQFSRVMHSSDGSLTTENYVLSPAEQTAVAAALAAPQASALSSLNTALATVPRWSKSTIDWAGRTIREERPALDGTTRTTSTKTFTYDSMGRLTKVTETGLADTLIEYDAWQQPYRTGLDLSTGLTDATPNGQLDPQSRDRITETDTYFEKHDATNWWRTVVTKVYSQDDSGTDQTMSTTRTRLNGYSDHGSRPGDFVQSEVRVTDANGNTTRKTVAVQRGNTTDTTLRLVTERVDHPDSTTDEVVVTRNGLVQSRQTKENLVYRTLYDALARPIKTTDPRTDTGSAPRIGYFPGTAAAGSRHKVAWTEDTAGNRTTFAYSATTGLLISETNAAPFSKVTHYAHNARGQVQRTWGAATSPVEYGYDTYGQRTSLRTWREAPAGVDFTTPAWGTATYPSTTGDVTTWSYDAATGLLLSKTTPPGSSEFSSESSRTESYTYTRQGQIKTRKSARNITTTYRYFGENTDEPKTGELRLVDYPDGSLSVDISYTYNRLGLTKTVTDATGERSFAYDSTGQLTQELLPSVFFGGRRLDYQFEKGAGVVGRATGYVLNRVSGTAPNETLTAEQTVVYGYDALGRFSRLSNTTASTAFDYGYTTNSPLVGSISEVGGGWQQTRTYEATRDVLDVIATRHQVALKARFDYAVDELGRRREVVKSGEMFARYGNGSLTTGWTYNDRSELESEKMIAGGETAVLIGRNLKFDYDLIGNRKTAESDQSKVSYASNGANQYESISGRRSMEVTGFAPAGAKVYVGETVVPDANRSGEYFATRVTPQSLPAWQEARIGLLATASASELRRWFFLPPNPEPLKYDAAGNLVEDGRWKYSYDAENRLVQMETLTSRVSPLGPLPQAEARRVGFVYDYLGRRVQKFVESNFDGTNYNAWKRTRFIYQGWNLIAEYAVTGGGTRMTFALQRHYTWGLDLAGPGQKAGGVGGLQLIVEADGTKRLPVYDGNGSVMALVNTNGTFAAVYEYDAYGQTLRADGPAAASNPFRFSTKYTDNESGLVYYGLRYYSPSTGRFINRDPIEEQGGLNLYAFCGNNGLNAWDYLGLFGIDYYVKDVVRFRDFVTPFLDKGGSFIATRQSGLAFWHPGSDTDSFGLPDGEDLTDYFSAADVRAFLDGYYIAPTFNVSANSTTNDSGQLGWPSRDFGVPYDLPAGGAVIAGGPSVAPNLAGVNFGGGAAGTFLALNGGTPISVNGQTFNFSLKPPAGAWIPPGGSTSELFITTPAKPNVGLRLDFGFNDATRATDWHWNQKGVSSVFGVTNHATAGAAATGNLVTTLKYGGRALVVGGVVMSGVEIATSPHPVFEAGRQASGWAGATAGAALLAKGGAALGAGIGVWFGAVGAVPGAAIGGFVGGIGGGVIGWFGGTNAYETVVPAPVP